jgi:predicted nucleic acid-binding Zn ribbon protein
MVATVARTCPICGDAFEFNPYGGNNSTCSPECGKEAFRRRQVVITPNATKGRMAKMTEDEFKLALRVSAWEARNEAAWAKKLQALAGDAAPGAGEAVGNG